MLVWVLMTWVLVKRMSRHGDNQMLLQLLLMMTMVVMVFWLR